MQNVGCKVSGKRFVVDCSSFGVYERHEFKVVVTVIVRHKDGFFEHRQRQNNISFAGHKINLIVIFNHHEYEDVEGKKGKTYENK